MQNPHFPFKPLELPYEMGALEPSISSSLMENHYNKIYLRDLLNLNSILAETPNIQTWSLEQIILYQIRNIPPLVQKSIKFFAGSVYNHDLYFDSVAPYDSTKPSGELLRAINSRYGSVTQLRKLMVDAARTLLGVGWVWLNSEKNGNVHIATTSNNETPQLSAVTPIFVIDIWEHAYMDQYDTRAELYVDNWFHVLDWDKAGQRFADSIDRTVQPAAPIVEIGRNHRLSRTNDEVRR